MTDNTGKILNAMGEPVRCGERGCLEDATGQVEMKNEKGVRMHISPPLCPIHMDAKITLWGAK